MLIKLEAKGFVDHKAYYGASLTAEGKKAATALKERHGRISRFLELIGVPSEQARSDAIRLEHNVDRPTVEQMVKFSEYLEGSRRGQAILRKFKVRKRHRAVKGGCPF